MNNYDYNDSELMLYINEENEIAKEIMFKKYYYLVDLCIKKYRKYYRMLRIDESDLIQEAIIAFSSALKKYNDKDIPIKSFIYLCINRRIKSFIKRTANNKNIINIQSLSLDYIYDDNELYGFLKNDLDEPLKILINEENIINLLKNIKGILSNKEYEVFKLLINNNSYKNISNSLGISEKSVDNSIQRIRKKIKIYLERK